MDDERTYDQQRLVVAAWLGMLCIVALPLSALLAEGDDRIGRIGVSLLTFATPATLLAAGRLRERAWMMSLGATLAIVLLPVVLLEAFIGLALLSVFAGPVVAAVAVGLPLQSTDTVAAAGFFGGGTIAVIGGFAAAAVGTTTAAGVVIVAGIIGLAVTTSRLTRASAG